MAHGGDYRRVVPAWGAKALMAYTLLQTPLACEQRDCSMESSTTWSSRAPHAEALSACVFLADGEGCAEAEEGRYLHPGLLQTGHRLTSAGEPTSEGAVKASPVLDSPPALAAPGPPDTANVSRPSAGDASDGVWVALASSWRSSATLLEAFASRWRGGANRTLASPAPLDPVMLTDLGKPFSEERMRHAVALRTGSGSSTIVVMALGLLCVFAVGICCMLRGPRTPQEDVRSRRQDPATGKLLSQQAGAGYSGKKSPPGGLGSRSPGPGAVAFAHGVQDDYHAPGVSSAATSLPGASPQQLQQRQARGPSSAHSAAPVVSSTPAELPALCPSLLLPNMESRFCIAMEALQTLRPGTIAMTGTSGRALLEISIQEAHGVWTLQISSMGCGDEPRAIIEMSPADKSSVKIYGRAKQYFGSIEHGDRPNECNLIVEGEVQMKVLSEPGPDLQHRAVLVDGRQIATAGRGPPRMQEWRLQVKPNADAVLIATCMLSMIFFGMGQQSRASVGAAPTVRQSTSRTSPPIASRSPVQPTQQPTQAHSGHHTPQQHSTGPSHHSSGHHGRR